MNELEDIRNISNFKNQISSEKELFNGLDTLKKVDFNDIYISEHGEGFFKGVSNSNKPLTNIPSILADEVNSLRIKVLDKKTKTGKEEFHIEHDNIRYRCTQISATSEIWFSLRKGKEFVPRISTLKLNKHIIKVLAHLGKGNGLILICGSMNSGKTTTASSLLQEYLLTYGDLAITIEDPIELPLDGVYYGNSRTPKDQNSTPTARCFQTEVSSSEFGEAIEKIMRQNPKYIYLGEIRSASEAGHAIRAALSGHLVITTIHGSSIVESIYSLLKMAGQFENIEMAREILANSLSAVIHQKIIRTINPTTSKIEKRLVTKSLFFTDKTPGARSAIRDNKIKNLENEIETQKNRILNNKEPVEF